MRQRVLTVEGKDSERLVVMKEVNSETATKEILWVRVSISGTSHDHDMMNGCFARSHKSTHCLRLYYVEQLSRHTGTACRAANIWMTT